MSPKSIGLISCCLLSAILGSVHAFSVFVSPLEEAFGATRGAVSLCYSFALVSITFSVLLGHRIYDLATPAIIFGLVAVAGAAGLFIASIGPGLWAQWIGFGVIFGLANGVGYGFSLQLAGRLMPRHMGLAMGAVTAAYAIGALSAPIGLAWAIAANGPLFGFLALAVGVLLVGLASAVLIAKSGARFGQSLEISSDAKVRTAFVVGLWCAYFGAVVAGLMTIGHASGLIVAMGKLWPVWLAPVIVAMGNLAGSLAGGALFDRFGQRLLLLGMPILTALGLGGLWAELIPAAGLVAVGFAYGATIAVYPAVISKAVGPDQSAKVYGKVFTAWGAAGLLSPWIAGTLYDRTDNYQFVLFLAIGLALFSTLVAAARPKRIR